MSRETSEQAFEIESRDQQGVAITSRGGKSVQSDHEQKTEGDCGTGAQFRQLESAASQRTVG